MEILIQSKQQRKDQHLPGMRNGFFSLKKFGVEPAVDGLTLLAKQMVLASELKLLFPSLMKSWQEFCVAEKAGLHLRPMLKIRNFVMRI